MSCFNCNTGDNWWWIILLLILLLSGENSCIDSIRDVVCPNLWIIIALLLLCNTGRSDTSDTSGCGCN